MCLWALHQPDLCLREIIIVFLALVFLYRMIWSVCHVWIGSNPSGNSPKRNILLQSGCNFLMPITKCWFGISGFLRLAAVSDFCDNLLKKLAGAFLSLTIIKKKNRLPSCTHSLSDVLYFNFLLYIFYTGRPEIEIVTPRQDARTAQTAPWKHNMKLK